MFFITQNPNFQLGRKENPWLVSKQADFSAACLCDLVVAIDVSFSEPENSRVLISKSPLAFCHFKNTHTGDLVARADGKLCTKLFPPRLGSDEGRIVELAKRVYFLPNGMIFCSLTKKQVNHKKIT